jgi:uncharacterized protein YqjF (DUF2071 family)
MIDRLSVRERPTGFPILHQRWSRLAFLHFRDDADVLRPFVPGGLSLDRFDEETWVSVVVFTATRMRPSLFPPIPGLSTAHQINLRTYVYRDGIPGLWFFSLDATNALAVWAARVAYRLPYYRARIEVDETDNRVSFRSQRTDRKARPALLRAKWEWGEPMPPAQPGTLEFFLVERYVLYSGTEARLLRARIHHRPWPLRRATITHLDSDILTAQGLRTQDRAPLVQGQAQPFDVSIWPPSRVRHS